MNFFKRDFETPDQIKNMSVEDILRIPPKKISTTKIMAHKDFNNLNPTKKEAVKYVAEQKRMRDEFEVPYPSSDKILVLFIGRIETNKQVDQVIDEAEMKDMEYRLENLNFKDKFQPTPRKGGAKRQSKKRQSQKKRKSQRRRRRYTRIQL
jgi:hypothetical protein